MKCFDQHELQLQNKLRKLKSISSLSVSLLMEKNPTLENPKESPYFKLMEIVGVSGKYQNISLIIWCVLWLTTGTILLGTPFMMFNPPYSCDTSNKQMSSEECQKYVCSLPESSRSSFVGKSSLTTISNSFGDLQCERAWVVDMLSSLVYLGCFFGYISISLMVDNMGRKKALLISYLIATVGMVVTAVAPNLYVVGIGLFLMGYGSDSAINICFYFITETMEAQSRQKYSILIQVFFCLGGVFNVSYYYLFTNWRLITWVFLIAPSAVCLVIIFKFIKDTPYFLIKLNTKQDILSHLNEINVINRREVLSSQEQNQLILVIEDLQELQHGKRSLASTDPGQQPQVQSKMATPLDLFRYPSLRYISIAVCLLSTFIYILYYGPLMLISKLSFNLYINALVVTASQLLTYPLSYFLIHRLPRRTAGLILYAICGAIAFGLIFIIANLCQEQEACSFLRILELICIFIFRFCSSLQFAIFLVYSNEVFPTQVRGIGIGISSALGTVASTSSPYIFGSRLDTNSSTSKIMIFFVVISLMGVGLWWKLPETLNRQIQDEIKQVNEKQQNVESERRNGFEGHQELVEIKQGD